MSKDEIRKKIQLYKRILKKLRLKKKIRGQIKNFSWMVKLN